MNKEFSKRLLEFQRSIDKQAARQRRHAVYALILVGLGSYFFYKKLEDNKMYSASSFETLNGSLDKEFNELGLKIDSHEKGVNDLSIQLKNLDNKVNKLLLSTKKDLPKSPYKKEVLPKQVKAAIAYSGKTLLKYEVNGGKEADQELVMAIYTRRLLDKAKNNPKLNSKQLVESVSRGWNPGLHRDFKAIAKSVKYKKSNINPEIVDRAINLEFETKVGKDIWDKKYSHFAHTKRMPAYYSRLPIKGVLNNKHSLKWETYIASNALQKGTR